jgi:alkanesulfonate monooxygenase SsuD/methylene tetrahydromethanopterin reductase-like flavin-dependent oxidoreductase (luciferase family)
VSRISRRVAAPAVSPKEEKNMRIGYKLATEAFGPAELIRQAVLAEEAGFEFVEMSDHYHPWLEAQGHSAFTWSVLPVIAAKTKRIGLATGVTCPSVRYHPAIIAQAAATMALVSDGRFTLGVGAGERLNEHVVGLGFPGERVRHERFREALEIIRLLWRGGYRSYEASTYSWRTPASSTCPARSQSSPWQPAGRFQHGSPRSWATGCSPPSRTATWSATGRTWAAADLPTPRCPWPGRQTRTKPRRRSWRRAGSR